MTRGISPERTGFVAESIELNGDVCAALTHELGGIAGALELRASALVATLAKGDHAALQALADEVRLVTRGVRLVRGNTGSDALLPTRQQSLEDWWRLVSRFTSFVLPRGVSIETHFVRTSLTTAQATTATWLWLAACKELGARGLTPPCQIALAAGPLHEGSEHVTLSAEVPTDRTPAARRSTARSRWIRYATRLAESNAAELHSWKRDGNVVRWQCTVPRA